MSSDIAIRVAGLSKCYHIYQEPHHRLLQMIVGKNKKYFKEFWALKDVTFSIKKGETVGIVGRNGSGKSTLLQLVSGTLNPTTGEIKTQGRIAALLELGSGFNPEFTGRENVYLYAAVLGYSQAEIEKNFPAIEAFADIGPFIDQPTKTYSSGMVIRLAFSVAIHVEPEILIIDEALSVGDELFQRKCFSKIEQIKQSGATILFVSHSGSTVVDLCDRAILLDNGEMLTSGTPKNIVGLYQKLLYAPPASKAEIRTEIRSGITTNLTDPKNESISKLPQSFYDKNLIPQSTINYETKGAKIRNPGIFSLSGSQVNCLQRGARYIYSYDVDFHETSNHVTFGMLIKTNTGIELGGATSQSSILKGIDQITANQTIRVAYEFDCNLNPGLYFLNAGVKGLVGEEETYLHRILDAAAFRVLPISENKATGLIDFKCTPKIEILSHKNKVSNL